MLKRVLATLLFVHGAWAQTGPPLKQGTYVSKGTACADAPLAEVQFFNGQGIQYPHLQGCEAHVTGRHGSAYTLDQVCAGGEHDLLALTVLGPGRYSVGEGAESTIYRFCSRKLQ